MLQLIEELSQNKTPEHVTLNSQKFSAEERAKFIAALSDNKSCKRLELQDIDPEFASAVAEGLARNSSLNCVIFNTPAKYHPSAVIRYLPVTVVRLELKNLSVGHVPLIVNALNKGKITSLIINDNDSATIDKLLANFPLAGINHIIVKTNESALIKVIINYFKAVLARFTLSLADCVSMENTNLIVNELHLISHVTLAGTNITMQNRVRDAIERTKLKSSTHLKRAASPEDDTELAAEDERRHPKSAEKKEPSDSVAPQQKSKAHPKAKHRKKDKDEELLESRIEGLEAALKQERQENRMLQALYETELSNLQKQVTFLKERNAVLQDIFFGLSNKVKVEKSSEPVPPAASVPVVPMEASTTVPSSIWATPLPKQLYAAEYQKGVSPQEIASLQRAFRASPQMLEMPKSALPKAASGQSTDKGHNDEDKTSSSQKPANR